VYISVSRTHSIDVQMDVSESAVFSTEQDRRADY
jgi:hypothetical protein